MVGYISLDKNSGLKAWRENAARELRVQYIKSIQQKKKS